MTTVDILDMIELKSCGVTEHLSLRSLCGENYLFEFLVVGDWVWFCLCSWGAEYFQPPFLCTVDSFFVQILCLHLVFLPISHGFGWGHWMWLCVWQVQGNVIS